MMVIVAFLMSFIALADAPIHWNHMMSISDRHEFYANNEMIMKPKDSWQTLFAVVYTDLSLKEIKDCVFYRVPGASPGILKFKTILSSDQCDKYILSPGDRETTGIRSLQFSTSPERLIMHMTFPKYRNEKWDIKIVNKFESPAPKMHLSSAEFKSPELIFLAPEKELKSVTLTKNLGPHTFCHEINDDCEEMRPSSCSECPEGWYEVPNGCFDGPKFCGRLNCGKKDEPACRRGMVWQRKEEQDFDCRMDSSFAYCAKGLTITCQGKLAYCR